MSGDSSLPVVQLTNEPRLSSAAAATNAQPCLKLPSIPAVAIVSTNGEVVYVTKDGELANARKMGENGIYEFFKRVTASAKAKK